MQEVDKDKFLFVYANTYAANGLDESQRSGISTLLDFLMADSDVSDLRHAAYMLATVKHECAGTWKPIKEYGEGKGHNYGVPDPATGYAYFGRGYVQLTWKGNYAAMGRILGADLLGNPDLALDPQVAYRIMSYGMRHGSFTGAALSRFIHDAVCDYTNARKIINGLDCADKIAGYATTIESILKEVSA